MPKFIAKSTSQICVRLDDALITRIDRVRTLLAETSAPFDIEVKRSDALRAILSRGLVVMEKSLISRPKRKRAKSKA